MKSTLSIVFWGILLSVISAFSLDIRDQTCPGKSLPISLKQIRLKQNTKINIFQQMGEYASVSTATSAATAVP
jgi:hypothetical protein